MKVLKILLNIVMLALGLAGMLVGAIMLRYSLEGLLYIICGITVWYIYYLRFTNRGKARRAKVQSQTAAKKARKSGAQLVTEDDAYTGYSDDDDE